LFSAPPAPVSCSRCTFQGKNGDALVTIERVPPNPGRFFEQRSNWFYN
jgi:hypothetical protein